MLFFISKKYFGFQNGSAAGSAREIKFLKIFLTQNQISSYRFLCQISPEVPRRLRYDHTYSATFSHVRAARLDIGEFIPTKFRFPSVRLLGISLAKFLHQSVTRGRYYIYKIHQKCRRFLLSSATWWIPPVAREPLYTRQNALFVNNLLEVLHMRFNRLSSFYRVSTKPDFTNWSTIFCCFVPF